MMEEEMRMIHMGKQPGHAVERGLSYRDDPSARCAHTGTDGSVDAGPLGTVDG